MTGVEKILERIKAETGAEIAQIRADAEEKSQAILTASAKEAAALEAKSAERIRRERGEIAARAASAAEAARRSVMLESRAKALECVYAETARRLGALEGQERLEFLLGVLRAALGDCHRREALAMETYGEDIRPAEYVLLLSAPDRAAFGEALVQKAGEPLILGAAAGISGGLILRCGDMTVNCSLEMILADAREQTEAHVYALLFD